MTHTSTICSLFLATVAATVGLAHADTNPLVNRIRQVDGRFLNVSEATKEGYSAIPCADGPDGGSMGVHYVDGALLKSGKIDIAHPQAIMYEPQADGKLVLVAVEYITFRGPASLDGHLFNYNASPNRWGLQPFFDLHVWAWRDNPRGTFAEMNPNVSCDAMPLTGK